MKTRFASTRMARTTAAWGAMPLALTLLLAGVQATAQQTPPAATASGSSLIQHTFAESDEGWVPIGTAAKVAATSTSTEEGTQKRALKVDYAIAKGDFNAVMLLTGEGKIAGARSIQFRVKADHTTPLGVILQEKDGGRWIATFTVPQGRWQTVELSPADFVLSGDKNDPKDPNEQLDIDRVEGIGLTDISQIFAQIDDAFVKTLFNIKTGAHTLYLSDFTVSANPLPPSGAVRSASSVVLDSFERPQVNWMGLGGVALSHVPSKGTPAGQKALQAVYRQAPGKLVGMVRPVAKKALVGRTHLALRAASAKPAKIVVQVEETGGGKYRSVLTVPGEYSAQNYALYFSQFDPTEDSKDNNNKLDLDMVHQIVFIDASGLIDSADDDNTLVISGLRAAAGDAAPTTPPASGASTSPSR